MKKKTIKKIKKEKVSDLEDDEEDAVSFKSDKSDDHRFGLAALIQLEEENKPFEIKPKTWVVVSYAIKTQKKQFIGEVISTDDDTCDVRFVRKAPGTSNLFQWTELCDEDLYVPFSDVIAVLDEPALDRRGFLAFHHKFDGLNIQ